MKKHFLAVGLIVVLSFSLIFFLLAISHKTKPNGFDRRFRLQKMELKETFQLPGSFFYFAGITDKRIYLKNLNNTGYLFSIHFELQKLQKQDLKLSFDPEMLKSKVNISFWKHVVYMTNRTGNLEVISKNKKHIFKNTGIKFDQFCPLSGRTVAVRERVLLNGEPRRFLTKLNYVKHKIEKKYLLKKMVDGYFCTDGILQFDTMSSRLFYVHFYRGTFLSLDTNLNLCYLAKTVDTINRPGFKVASLSEVTKGGAGSMITPTTPPIVVNRNFTINGDYMYILSALKADNESHSTFRKNQVIDVYLISNGKYQHSFYIPKYKKLNLSEFRIQDSQLIAIYNNMIVKYQLR